MRFPKFVCILPIILCYSIIFSNTSSEYKKAIDFLEKRNEVYFKFWVNDYTNLDKLHDHLSIESVHGLEVTAYANRDQFKNFLTHSLVYTIETPPGMEYEAQMSDYHDIEGEFKIDKYPTYDAYLKLLEKFQTDYPKIVKVTQIGTSVKNRKLMVVKISDNVEKEEPEPKFFATGNIHGDETEGFVLMLKALHEFCSQYGKNEKLTDMVDNIQIYFLPLTNPDGLYNGGNNTVSGAKRSNGNGADLNRSFPCKCGKTPTAQPETKALIKFAKENVTIASYIDFHGGVEVLLYPWSCAKVVVADKAWWDYVMGNYCDVSNDAAGKKYMKFNIAFSLYNRPTHGTTKDYWTFHRPSRGCTMELWNTKTIRESDFEKYYRYNRQAFLDYINQVRYGIRGIVTDTFTNEPVDVKVGIAGHDKDNSFFVSEPKFGDYYRLITKGTYDVVFTSPKYHSKTIKGVTVKNDEATVLDVKLKPLVSDIHTSHGKTTASLSMVKEGRGLRIRLPKEDHIAAMVVYASNGKIVQIITPQASVSTNQLSWNGLNNTGKPIGKGLYLIEVQTEQQTHRMKHMISE